MKFLTGLLRIFKFKRGGRESAEKNERSEQTTEQTNEQTNEQSGQNEQKEKNAKGFSIPRRFKIIIAGVALALFVILGFTLWGVLYSEGPVQKSGANAWTPISEADEALFHAVRNGSAEDVRRRLFEGGNPHSADKLGLTPLKAAIALGRAEAVREFSEAARSGSYDEWNALFVYAVIQNRPQVVKEMAKLPLDLNALDKNGYTPLLYAIDRNHLMVVKELLSAGADANLRGGDGVSPLIAAVTRGKHDMVSELLKAGADWRVTSPSGETAIGMARQRNRDAIVALLMEAEAPPKRLEDMYQEYMKLPPDDKGDLSAWTQAKTAGQLERQPARQPDTL